MVLFKINLLKMNIFVDLILMSTLLISGCNNNTYKNKDSTNGEPNTIEFDDDTPSSNKTITGTIYFGSTLEKGTVIQVGYINGLPKIGGYSGNGVVGEELSADSNYVKFKFSHISPPVFEGDLAQYSLFARADRNKSGKFDSGDIGGYYDASNSKSSTTFDKASLIDLTTVDSSEANFTLKPEP